MEIKETKTKKRKLSRLEVITSKEKSTLNTIGKKLKEEKLINNYKITRKLFSRTSKLYVYVYDTEPKTLEYLQNRIKRLYSFFRGK